MSFENRVRRAGFRVFRRRVEYRDLLGGRVEEERIVGYDSEGRAKITYRERGGRGELHITMTGEAASRGAAERAEKLGASIDFDEGSRLYAVFRGVTREEAGEIVESMFPRGAAGMARKGRRGG